MAQFTTREIADKLATDPRTLRKFLRADAKANEGTTPGKGARYVIEGKDIKGLKSRFAAWAKAGEEAKAAKVEAKVEAPAEVNEVEDEATEPTDADIEAMAELELDD